MQKESVKYFFAVFININIYKCIQVATLLHRALLTSFLCKQTSVTTLTVVRYLHPASIFNPGNPHIQKNQSYRLLHSVVDSTFVSCDVNVRNFYRQSLPASSKKTSCHTKGCDSLS